MPVFLEGLWNTFWISAVSIVLALAVGVLAGLVRASNRGWLAKVVAAYVALIRSTPLLVQVYIIFFGLPYLNIIIPPFQAGILALVLNSGAYVTEIVRAGIEGIPKGQMEAARAVGLSYAQAMRFVIIPQALRATIPPLIGQFSYLIKDSSLLSAIGVVELTRAATQVNTRSFRPVEAFAPVFVGYMAIYLILSVVSAVIGRRIQEATPEGGAKKVRRRVVAQQQAT